MEYLPGNQASQIRRQSEIYGVFSGGEDEGYGFVSKEGQYFKIVTKGWEETTFTPEFEARLAKEVETKLGKEDLTIILY